MQSIFKGTTEAKEVVLLIEVADSSLKIDLGKKADMYSRARITDYWVLDIANRSIHVHRQPTPDGYLSMKEYSEYESISLLSRPDATITPHELLPPVNLSE